MSLFGPLCVIDEDRQITGRALGGAKVRDLLAILLLARGHAVSKDALAESLWGDSLPKHVSGTLEHYACLLRHRLFGDLELSRRVIVTEYNAYRFDLSGCVLDLDRFDELLTRAEHANAAARRALLDEAVRLARGDLVEDAPYAFWVQPHRELYRNLVARARLWLAAGCVLEGDFVAAIRHSEEALRISPYSEQAFRTIMVSDHALGHHDLARATYTRCRDLLADALGTDPTSETEKVAAAIDAGALPTELIDMFIAPRWSEPGLQQPVTARGLPSVNGRHRQPRAQIVIRRTNNSVAAVPLVTTAHSTEAYSAEPRLIDEPWFRAPAR